MKLLKFLPNRVWRVYRGGACLDQLRSVPEPADGSFPEEWIASTVAALNPQHGCPGEGISRVLLPDGSAELFDRVLEREAESLLGPNHPASAEKTPGFLTKLLDSAIRLPIQAHPDRTASQRLFHSPYGKTEAWIVLGGRRINGEEPYLLMGFNDRFDFEVFRREALSGVMKQTLGMMHRYPITPGEVILIPGGFPHAIGSGVLVQEIMEPTDWVIQPEAHCGEQPLTMRDRFGGLDPEEALSVFHREILALDQLRAKVLQTPVVLSEDDGATLTSLIDRNAVRYFGSLELKLHRVWERPETLNTFMAGTVLEGQATVTDGAETISLQRGDTFAVGASAHPRFTGEARILLALPPVSAV